MVVKLWFILLFLLVTILNICKINCNRPPVFVKNVDLSVIQENTPIGSFFFKLEAQDPENSTLRFGLENTSLFIVDSKTGIISVNQKIDREKLGESISFFVTCEDIVGQGHQNNLVRVPVTVFIIDENDNPPFFDFNTNQVLKINVSEDSKVGTIIIPKISARDVDLVGSILKVHCEACNQIFNINLLEEATINHIMFSLSLSKKIEYEPNMDLIKIKLVVSDGFHETGFDIAINVIDTQNKPPIFIGSNTAVILENVAIGTLVLTLKAVDGDFFNLDIYQPSKNQLTFENEARAVIYELLTNPFNCFSLDLKNGELRVQNKLDKEQFPLTNGVITLKVKATEVDDINKPYIVPSDSFSSSVNSITITLQDVNDEFPQFNKQEYHVSLPEGVPNGTPLSSLDMMIEDKDTGSNSVFNIVLIDDWGIFSVEPPLATGSSSVSIKISKGPLDYENPNQRKFILLVVATEAFTEEKFSSTATVLVNVEDVNDNPPTFDEEFYIGSVSEDAAPGTIIKTIKASDRDSPSLTLLTYSLFGNGAELFSVDQNTGVITVANCETPGKGNCIDFETRNNYYLSYQANDGFGQSTVVPLTIKIMDANDNAPYFLREIYSAVIDEGAEKFEPPLKVTAKDADVTSIITYSIITGNSENLFFIDSRSGEIKVNKTVRSKNEKIQIKVQASDGKRGIATAVVDITIRDANDNTPVFKKVNYYGSVSESAENGVYVSKVTATDSDSGINAKINYFIEKGAYDTFTIDSETGVITVVNNSLLDFDRKNNYEIQIIAVDQGVPSKTGTTILEVKVINDNDKLPYFVPTTQHCEVNENSQIKTRFCKLNATDPDTDSSYSLRYNIVSVEALDKNVLKINPRNYAKIQQMFAVDPLGYLMVSSKLDREIAAIVILNVSATDISSSTINAQIGYGNIIVSIIDHNDHPPLFAKPWTLELPELFFTIFEEQPVGIVVANILATDFDSKINHYSIEPENEFFKIDSKSGAIVTRKVIDFEKLFKIETDSDLMSPITFNVFAYDSGIPQLSAKAVVTINVININDNEPIFSQQYYNATINEDISPGMPVITIQAYDADRGRFGKIKYSIISQTDYKTNSGTQVENFVIDQNTGIIKVALNAQLDREMLNSQITLQVAATDNSEIEKVHDELNLNEILSQTRTLSIPVYITVADVNDNSPVFTQKEYEGTILSHFDGAASRNIPILYVEAKDPDDGINGQVRYNIVSGNIKSLFEINSNSGLIYAIASPNDINKNIKDYRLKIEARDLNGQGPFFDETIVKIKVIEMNLHKPKFIMPSTSIIQFLENQKPNTKVLKVEAYDEDIGNNGVIGYSFKINNSNNAQETEEFKINFESGLITSKISFDREKKDYYDLVLSTRDYLGTPQVFESLQKITIKIKDIDDNKPEFIRTNKDEVIFTFSIAENEPRGTVIGKVKAIDRDENGKIYYFIINGNLQQQFHINKNLGIIYSNVSFDRETQSEYYLLIKASSNPNYTPYIKVSDQAEGLSKALIKDRNFYDENDLTQALVKIEITDVNDNKPSFTKPIYRAGVYFKSEIGRSLNHLIKAYDADQGNNSNLIYSISSIDLYRKGYDSPDKPVRPIPSPFFIDSNTGKIVTTQLMAQYPIDSRFVLHIEAREKVSPHSTTYTKVHLWVYDESKMIRVTIKLKPQVVNLRKEEIENMLSNITEQRAIINEIKYHFNNKVGRLIKKWSDVYVLVVDDTTFINLSPNQIISKLDSKALFLDKEKSILIEEVGLATSAVITSFYTDLEKFDSVSFIFVTLLILITFGVIAMLISCCCLKSWYHQNVIAKASKAALKSKIHVMSENCINSNGNGSTAHFSGLGQNEDANRRSKSKKNSTADGQKLTSNADKRQQVPKAEKENPLWTETSPKFYEEQELTFRLTPNGAMFDNINGPSSSNVLTLQSEFNPYSTVSGTMKTRIRQREPNGHYNYNQEYQEMNEKKNKQI